MIKKIRKFMGRRIISYRPKSMFFVLGSDSVEFIVTCEYWFFWIIRFRKDHEVDVSDLHIGAHRDYWDRVIAEDSGI